MRSRTSWSSILLWLAIATGVILVISLQPRLRSGPIVLVRHAEKVDSSKFEEYRVVPNGPSMPFLNFAGAKGTNSYAFFAKNVSQKDQRYSGRAAEFARFFRVPGMGHSRGGPATDQFDMLPALVTWVEQGVAPDRVVAQARGAGNAVPNTELPAGWAANRTRPLCPFPQVARYRGQGDPERAESFDCR